MDAATQQRYQSGGDIYANLAAQYGDYWANTIAAAALTGSDANVQAAIENARTSRGVVVPTKDASLLDALGNQLYNDPLGAPLDQAGTVAKNTFSDLGNAAKTAFKSAVGNWGIWMIAIVLLIAAFFYFGGGAVVRGRVSKL